MKEELTYKQLQTKLNKSEECCAGLKKALDDLGVIKKYNGNPTRFLVIAEDGTTTINGEVFNPLEVIQANRKLIETRDQECEKLRIEIKELKEQLKAKGNNDKDR